jgi:hypothetical protein
LEVAFREHRGTSHLEDTFLLVTPHITRLQSLSIVGTTDLLQNLTQHLSCPIPLLKELTIDITCNPTPVLNNALFNGDLSSLCILSLAGVITNLPWRNLSRLTTFELGYVPEGEISITKLLNFFVNAPHLTDITLHHSITTSSNAPPERVVSLPYLKSLTVFADPAHSILLNHLSIPSGASLVLDFNFRGDESPLPDYLPKTTKNLRNIFRIASANLHFGRMEKSLRLDRPCGGLYMFGYWKDWVEATSLDLDRQILQSLDYFSLHMIRKLAIAEYRPLTVEVNEYSLYHILRDMKDLRTLTLTQCNNLPFILALDPEQNHSKRHLCPKLEELVLYVESQNAFNIPELIRMAKERASRGVKLSSITIIGLGELVSGKEVFKLREHVARVDYRVEEEPPEWDDIAN